MQKRFLFLMLFCLIPSTCWPVDGYKTLKFGMSKAAVKKSHICSFGKVATIIDGLDTCECSDLQFNGEAHKASAYFINGKFLRLTIYLPGDALESVLPALLDKYGRESAKSSKKDFGALAEPNREAFFSFDKNTVILRLVTDETDDLRLYLHYESPKYERLLLDKQTEAVKTDL